MLLPGATETSAESGAAKVPVAKSTSAPSERDHETFKPNPNKSILTGTLSGCVYLACVRILDARQPGRHHENDSFSDSRYSRPRSTVVRGRTGKDRRPSSAIILPGSRHRDHE